MKRHNPNPLNRKNQNGSKNPLPGKEFTPNGAVWIGYDSNDESCM